jgi:hypothetical protein
MIFTFIITLLQEGIPQKLDVAFCQDRPFTGILKREEWNSHKIDQEKVTIL